MNFGHVIIQKNGRKCNCGSNGCFEKYCSMKALKDEISDRKNIKSLTGQELYQIIKADNQDVKEVVDEFIDNLNIGLSNYVNIFKPEVICIGGSFVYYKDLLLGRLTGKMHEEKLCFYGEIPEILVAECKNDAGIIGATILQ